ncbi:achaete-scute homolog 5-like [Ptychodera flava]|uniref:achaete-scute homolog 5-like n=1 Tax=Ptychodera flava TaxID=63121 RepID=UPI00396A0F53
MEDCGTEPVAYSTPTCVQLGIPMTECAPGNALVMTGEPRSEDHHVAMNAVLDPIYPSSYMPSYPGYVPLPHPFGYYDYEPSFIRRRNERERERVRCVNEGYVRLREHIPMDNPEKRLSKVETLRAAIKYIKHLQDVLSDVQNIDPNEKKS